MNIFLSRVLLKQMKLVTTTLYSSIARGRGARGGYSSPIGMSTKMQNEKNTTFLALLRLFYALKWTK